MPSKYIRKNTAHKPTGRKAAPTGTDADLNLSTLSRLFGDENAARDFLESKRWPNGPVCPHCGSTEAYRLISHKVSKRPMRPGVCKCKACRKQFTVRVGTIFEESKLPLRKWLMAFHLMSSSKKGVSSHQLARELDVTIKTAWFLSHRVRECMKQEPLAGMLNGVVEADESYVGGKPRPVAGEPRRNARGRGSKKTPVLVLVERGGAAVCKPLPNCTADEIRKYAMLIAPEATFVTDEFKSYPPIGKQFAAHYTVNHGTGEYARTEDNGFHVHSNTAESFFALLKRGHYGTFHQYSKHHMHRYCTEFAFRWTHRKVSDGHRMVAAIENAPGKRLMYKGPMQQPPAAVE